MFALKNGSDRELSEANVDARLIKTVAQKYSPNDVSIVLFTDEKILFTVTTHRMTDCVHVYQPIRKTS